MQNRSAVERFLDAVRTATTHECDVWTPDVVLDATVPHWRFHRKGSDAVREVFGGWYADPGTYDELRRIRIPGGELVDFVLSWIEAGIPHTMHQVHVLELDGDRIAQDLVFCGGRWPASLMAQMEAADAR